MSILDTFPWPKISGIDTVPTWSGSGFICGDHAPRVLTYGTADSHWSDDLTSMHEAEAGRHHPIDITSRQMAVASMASIQNESPVLLDVGCSSGFVLEELREKLPRASLIGADYLPGPLERLAERIVDIPILQFDLRKCPLVEACIDGVTCLNVLEHIDDHVAALREIHRILKPGGIAHVEIPAGPELFDIYDECLLHYRRYRLAELVALATEVGFRVEKATHLGCLIFPAFWVVKKKNRRLLNLPAAEKQRLVAQQIRTTGSSPILSTIMKIETFFGSYLSFPWGIRCVVVLRKEPTPKLQD